MDTRNIIDDYKGWTEDLIKQDLATKLFPFAVCMFQLQGDFNFGCVIRNANAFGAEKVIYIGNKKWDRRSAVGTHHYTDVLHLKTFDDLYDNDDIGDYNPVALEISPESVSIEGFEWPERPLIVIGEENAGIPQEVLDRCANVVHIPMYGSVRSLNAGVASGIACFDYITKYKG